MMGKLIEKHRNDCWTLQKCPHCHYGRVPAGVFGPADCRHCNGTGRIVVYGAGRAALAQEPSHG